ncbi:MAG: hypothetical protein HYR60_15405 [Acidobacteria bacterium]|nr:hypothetical protein [Acidobacteriota bacterium]
MARRIGVPAAKAAPVKTRSKKEKKKGKADLPAPPLPAPPPPPEDWAELSRPQATAAEPKAAPPDDWTLIRNAAGQVGWVLTRRLYMAIPVEVAQYAEGRRISSYFALGETRDGEETKKTWLWTTVEQGLQPHDFDSLRVFIWSVRRHRYETAYIERNLKGFFPVLLQPVDPPKQMRAKMTGKLPGFKVQIVKKDGRRYRRSYAYWDNKVRLSGDEPAPEPPPEPARAELPLLASARGEPAPPPESSWYGRVKQSVGDWRKRLFGR